jgi:hypothetical protein
VNRAATETDDGNNQNPIAKNIKPLSDLRNKDSKPKQKNSETITKYTSGAEEEHGGPNPK